MRTLLITAFVVASCGSAILAQSTAGLAGISGVVRDATGSAVPNAKVGVTNELKGVVRNLATNDAGVFTAPALVPAPGYSVSVNAQGFAAYDAKDIELLV